MIIIVNVVIFLFCFFSLEALPGKNDCIWLLIIINIIINIVYVASSSSGRGTAYNNQLSSEGNHFSFRSYEINDNDYVFKGFCEDVFSTSASGYQYTKHVVVNVFVVNV